MITVLKYLGTHNNFTLNYIFLKYKQYVFVFYFRDTKQQKCYCNAQKCRGVISKKSRTLYDENDDYENNITTIIKPGESKEKKEKNIPKSILLKNSKRLQEVTYFYCYK